MENKLELLRKDIDKIDEELVKLVSNRIKVIKEIGIYKKQNNIKPLQPKRWEKVLNSKIDKAIELNINPELIKDIYNRIHKESLRIERL